MNQELDDIVNEVNVISKHEDAVVLVETREGTPREVLEDLHNNIELAGLDGVIVESGIIEAIKVIEEAEEGEP